MVYTKGDVGNDSIYGFSPTNEGAVLVTGTTGNVNHGLDIQLTSINQLLGPGIITGSESVNVDNLDVFDLITATLENMFTDNSNLVDLTPTTSLGSSIIIFPNLSDNSPDKIMIEGYGNINSFDDLVITQNSSYNTVIQLDDSTSITIVNIRPEHISADDFIFA